MGKISRTLLAFSISLLLMVFIYIDYRSKRKEFGALRREYELSLSFEQTKSQIDNYFFKHGWFPDSLVQVDSVYNFIGHWNSIEEYRDTPYRFIVDPFTGKLFYYIPVLDKKNNNAEAYFLLSAGIDSKLNHKHGYGSLELYDSVVFNYLDLYFGKKDLLVSKGSIEDWIEAPSREFSLKELMKRYDPSGRKALPRSVKFYGVVDSVSGDWFSVKDIESELKAICYLAPSVGELALDSGDTIRVKGVYSRLEFASDTTFIILNCVVLEKGQR